MKTNKKGLLISQEAFFNTLIFDLHRGKFTC